MCDVAMDVDVDVDVDINIEIGTLYLQNSRYKRDEHKRKIDGGRRRMTMKKKAGTTGGFI